MHIKQTSNRLHTVRKERKKYDLQASKRDRQRRRESETIAEPLPIFFYNFFFSATNNKTIKAQFNWPVYKPECVCVCFGVWNVASFVYFDTAERQRNRCPIAGAGAAAGGGAAARQWSGLLAH